MMSRSVALPKMSKQRETGGLAKNFRKLFYVGNMGDFMKAKLKIKF